jgi:hypothetical protein
MPKNTKKRPTQTVPPDINQLALTLVAATLGFEPPKGVFQELMARRRMKARAAR